MVKSTKQIRQKSNAKAKTVVVPYKNQEAAIRQAIHYHQAGQLSQAEKIYCSVLQHNPNHNDALHLLGIIAAARKEYEQAAVLIRQAIGINDKVADYHNNLANVLRELYQLEQAAVHYQRALQLNPNYAQAYGNLGNVYKDLNKLPQAIDCYRQALSINPNLLETLGNLGNVLNRIGDLTEAIRCYQRILAINPNYAEAWHNLGKALKNQGFIHDAITNYRRALSIKPSPSFYSSLLFALNYTTEYDPTTIFIEHRKFQDYAKSVQPLASHKNDTTINRRLKIGYVSADFRRHVVAYFMEGILASHDHEQFEIICYYNSLEKDQTSDKLRPYFDQWIDCALLSDQALITRIQQDCIDILVDLAGHTPNNRLLVFAAKPAPVQATYLGYPNTTGLTTIDYHLTDEHADPTGIAETVNIEQPIRLPVSYFCYTPEIEAPEEVSTLPALSNGYVTFGSFNHYAKLSPDTVRLWASVLTAIPTAKLLLKAKSLIDSNTEQLLKRQFNSLGIESERLVIADYAITQREHLNTYQRVDIALDSYPYNGATTTCEALYMGIPVVTLVGNTHASRVGFSLLSALNLPELIAYTQQEYQTICLTLATQLSQLDELRATLRMRLQNSSIMDAKSLTSHLEQAYRQMWREWINKTVL